MTSESTVAVSATDHELLQIIATEEGVTIKEICHRAVMYYNQKWMEQE